MKLSTEQIISLLELYKNYEPLYNVRHKEHKDKFAKQAYIKELTKKAADIGKARNTCKDSFQRTGNITHSVSHV